MKKRYFAYFLLVLVVFITGCTTNQEDDLVEQTRSVGKPMRELPKSILPSQDESLFTGEIKIFDMTAKKFSFEPNELTLKRGDKVKLIITSLDTAHGFAIPEYGINIVVKAGETVIREFIADKSGQFDFACSVFCGSGHSQMKGKLTVI